MCSNYVDNHRNKHLKPIILAKNVTGRVKWFNPSLGYGFIHRDDNDQDIFVHQTEIVKIDNNENQILDEDEDVEFNVTSSKKGFKALHVIRLKKVSDASTKVSIHNNSNDSKPKPAEKPKNGLDSKINLTSNLAYKPISNSPINLPVNNYVTPHIKPYLLQKETADTLNEYPQSRYQGLTTTNSILKGDSEKFFYDRSASPKLDYLYNKPYGCKNSSKPATKTSYDDLYKSKNKTKGECVFL